MTFNFYAHLHVKFRAFGVTFGQVDEVFAVSVVNGNIAFSTGGSVPTVGATTIYNNRGVLLEVWL